VKRLVPAGIAAALLALPAPALGAAVASSPHRTATAEIGARNAAFACRVLRDTHPRAFAGAFGSYRTCVARHVRALRRHRPLAFTLRNLALNTSGSVTTVDPNPACRQSPTGCTLTISGTVGGLFGGRYSTTWTALWAQADPNGAFGFCAVATGTVTLTLPPLGTLVQSSAGRLCEIGATGANVGHTLSRAKFAIESWHPGTTGAFRKGAGAGSVSFVQKPGPTSALGGQVSGAIAFSAFTLRF
jgi:hypothetical protein